MITKLCYSLSPVQKLSQIILFLISSLKIVLKLSYSLSTAQKWLNSSSSAQKLSQNYLIPYFQLKNCLKMILFLISSSKIIPKLFYSLSSAQKLFPNYPIPYLQLNNYPIPYHQLKFIPNLSYFLTLSQLRICKPSPS